MLAYLPGFGLLALWRNVILPNAVSVAEALADANFAEAAFRVKGTVGGIFPPCLGLEGPIPLRFRGADESDDERGADTLFLSVLIDVDANLTGVAAP